MKLSVSLSEADVTFVDDFAHRTGIGSRSAVLHAAITMLRSSELADDYMAAFAEWSQAPDAELWESASADGLLT